jgi:hypothetical protein
MSTTKDYIKPDELVARPAKGRDMIINSAVYVEGARTQELDLESVGEHLGQAGRSASTTPTRLL